MAACGGVRRRAAVLDGGVRRRAAACGGVQRRAPTHSSPTHPPTRPLARLSSQAAARHGRRRLVAP
eukprot:6981475-Prymnesium_polylepis.1